MFWKKRQPYTEMAISDMLTHETSNKRDAFRYRPSLSAPLIIRFLEKKIELVDISAGGLSFKNQGFSKGDRDMITLVMGDRDFKFNRILSIAIRILSIDADNICHCVFEKPNNCQTESIHRFLLIKQKKNSSKSHNPNDNTIRSKKWCGVKLE